MSILLKNIFKKGSEKESSCVLLLRLQNRVVSAAARPVWGHLALPWVCGGLGAGRPAVPSVSLRQEGLRASGLVEGRGGSSGALRAASSVALASCVFSLLCGAQDSRAWTSWGTSGGSAPLGPGCRLPC